MTRRPVPLARLEGLLSCERELTAAEASERRRRYGPNDIVEAPPGRDPRRSGPGQLAHRAAYAAAPHPRRLRGAPGRALPGDDDLVRPGPESKIAFAALYAFIPTMLTALAGVAALSPALAETARALGATRAQQVLYIALPASLPSSVAALRLGGALVIVGVIVAEMLGAGAGLGYLITRQRTMFDSPGVYAGSCWCSR